MELSPPASPVKNPKRFFCPECKAENISEKSLKGFNGRDAVVRHIKREHFFEPDEDYLRKHDLIARRRQSQRKIEVDPEWVEFADQMLPLALFPPGITPPPGLKHLRAPRPNKNKPGKKNQPFVPTYTVPTSTLITAQVVVGRWLVTDLCHV